MLACQVHGITKPTSRSCLLVLALATREGLDLKRFTADLDSPETQKAVARDREDGDRAGVTGTPTIYINGQHYNGLVSLEALRPIIDAELKKPAGKK